MCGTNGRMYTCEHMYVYNIDIGYTHIHIYTDTIHVYVLAPK